MEGLSVGTINLIVLPILGGYWFQYKFTLTHYRAERLTPQRLIFHAGLFAIGLLVVARLMIYVAELIGKPHTTHIESYLVSMIFAFSALLLLAIAAAGFQQYLPILFTDNSEKPKGDGEVTPRADLQRFALGIALVVVVGVAVWIVRGAIRDAELLATELDAIAIFVLLLVLAKWHHSFINRYMEFSYFSISLRIGLFGVVALWAFFYFVFNYSLLSSHWTEMVHLPGSALPAVACGLGLVLWWPLNFLYPYQAANTRLHEANGTTALDRLLYQSSLTQQLLCISMKDGKVYIGYIQELPPNPEDRNSYFEILPVHSGYRDKDTREMKLTTFYESAYESLVNDDASEEEWLMFLKVLKIDDILSAGRFDPEAYVKFREEAPQPVEMEASVEATG